MQTKQYTDDTRILEEALDMEEVRGLDGQSVDPLLIKHY